MPKFIFNKLIRDKLRDEYERVGQKAVYRALSKTDHIKELKRKIIEEANEIPAEGHLDDAIGEIADVQQALNDLIKLLGVSNEQIEAVTQKKFDKKGGFTGATFVETLEMDENDEWAEYYRADPKQFPELGLAKENLQVPELKAGKYKHYKGGLYEVIGVGLESETTQPVVIYQPLYETSVRYWVRPYDMFTGTVELDGKVVPRFKKV